MNPKIQHSPTDHRPGLKRAGVAFLTLLGGIAAALLLVLLCANTARAQASVIIDITPQEQSILPGHTAPFTVVITNSGTITLTQIEVRSEFCNCSAYYTSIPQLQSLKPGASYTYTCSTGWEPLYVDLESKVTVLAVPEGSTDQVTASDTAVVHAEHLAVWQTPELQSVKPGEIATFTMALKNTGNFTLTHIAVSNAEAPDCNRTAGSLGTLTPNESCTYTCQTEPLFTDFESKISATADLLDQGAQATDKNLAVVEVLTPLAVTVSPERQMVSLNKLAPLAITVKNTGDTVLTDLCVTASNTPDCERAAGELRALAPGGSHTYDCETNALSTAQTEIITATANDNGTKVNAQGRAFADVSPVVGITIDPPQQFRTPGQTATFTITVSNIQTDTTLTGASVVAATIPDCSRDSLPDLSPNTSYTYTCQTQTWGKITNEVTVLAVDPSSPVDADPVGIAVSAAAGAEIYHFPLIFKDFATGPDLTVDTLAATTHAVTVTIKNAGIATVTQPFWVDLYFEPSQTPTLNHPWDTLAPAGVEWGVTQPLAPDESLILTSASPYYFGPPGSSTPPYPSGVPVYAFVDSVNHGTDYGNVWEGREGNNLGGPVISTESTHRATLQGHTQSPPATGLPER